MHANARLNLHGRLLLVERVCLHGRPVAHVARELGISRQCGHRWIGRYLREGVAGLGDRSSRPHRQPSRTSPRREQLVLAARAQMRVGPARVGAATGVPARTVSRILARHHVPRLAECDPLTGIPIRAQQRTTRRYERSTPGELVHVDVKKLGRIPPKGGWRAHGRGTRPGRHRGLGYDYIHAAVDDHSRYAYAEILPDEKGGTCAAFLTRAAAAFAEAGITTIERVITDNAFAYRHSREFQAVIAALGARQKFIRPHCPWQNGKVERFNRTLATEWAYRQVFTSNDHRTLALEPWLRYYNTQRPHTGCNGHPPTSRLSPT